MNCINLKKGDKVIVYHKSFCGESVQLCSVKRVYKHKITLTNDYSYWRDNGKMCVSSPFCINEIIEIK